MNPAVFGVLGGSGGIGASTFAAVLALLAGALLVDLDVCGGGIDVLLGIEAETGARWSGLRVAGGHLDPAALAAGLPRAGPCLVLAADSAPDPPAVAQVIAAAAGPVVLDLPRAPCELRSVALACCDLVVLLARADVSGLVAAHAVASGVRAESTVPVGVLVRHGVVPASQAASAVGAPLLGSLPALGRGRLDPRRPPRPVRRVAAGLLAGVRRGGR